MNEDSIYNLVEQVKRQTGLPARYNTEKMVVEVLKNGTWVERRVLTEG